MKLIEEWKQSAVEGEVENHGSSSDRRDGRWTKVEKDATGLSRGTSRSSLHNLLIPLLDATALGRGGFTFEAR